MQQFLKQPILYLALLIIGSSAGCASIRDVSNAQEQPAANQSTQLAQADLNYVAQVVQEVGPVVVRIDSTRTIEQSFFSDPILERFFGDRFPTQERVQRGTGSGFITTADGQVLTNAHVVANADRVTVVLKDGRRFPGKVVGADPVTDVAVVKIDATGLPTVELGNSETVLPGQWAIAIGNPLGLSNTVTQGIVSATERSSSDIGVSDKRIDFIQTDAAINPGNSGGPLLNAEGEVIGINTAIIQGAQGLGFAIPIATAQRIAEQIATTGKAEHPYLGIQMAELSPTIRAEINQSDLGFRVNQDQGVVIIRVEPNSPAARAGLRPGDLIVSINGVAIQNADQVQDQVEANGLDKPLQVTVNRNGRSQAIAVKPAPLPVKPST